MKKHTRQLLEEYAAHRRAEARAKRAPPNKHTQEADRVADDLRRVWADEGDDFKELEKLLRQADFREHVLALYRDAAATVPHRKEYKEATETQKTLTVGLRDFWLSSGHDLSELRRFESAVDAEVASLIVK